MGRNRSTTRPSEEDNVSTTTEAPVVSTEEKAPEAPAPVAEIDLTAFNEALAGVIATRDAKGGIAEDAFAPVVTEYRQLDGIKAKNAARKVVDDAMTQAMDEDDLPLAKANLLVSKHLTAGSVPKEKAEKVPVDPTEAFVQLVTGLTIAQTLVQGAVPEGVAEDWPQRVTDLVAASEGQAEEFLAWTKNDAEDKGDAPEVPGFVQGAVKLALGKSGKIGAPKRASSGTSTFTGERRDVGKHILEAFAGVEKGAFLTVAEIRAFKSGEYGEDHPSAGAVSARLFPKSGNVTVEGVAPGQNEKGVKGATKL